MLINSALKAQIVPYHYVQDFETLVNPFQFWTKTAGATYTVNAIEITNSTASSGAYSLKMDINLYGTSNPNQSCYYYWRMQLNPAPNLDDSLSFSIDVKMDSLTSKNVQIGYRLPYLPVSSGVRKLYAEIHPNTWTTISEQNVGKASYSHAQSFTANYIYAGTPTDVGRTVEIALLMYATGAKNYVLYLDNIKLSGYILSPDVFNTNISTNWAAYIVRAKDSVQIRHTIRNNLPPIPFLNDDAKCFSLASKIQRMKNDSTSIDSILTYMDGQLAANLTFDSSHMTQLDYLLNDYQVALNDYLTARSSSGAFTLYDFPATEYYYRLDGFNTPFLDTVTSLNIRMCRGEKKPIAFLLSPKSCSQIIIADWTDFTGPQNISKNILDVYVAKIWYRAGLETLRKTGKFLAQDLLLKDDSLVIVDDINGYNYLRVEDPVTHAISYIDVSTPTATFPSNVIVMDSATLQPFILDSVRHKLIYGILNIPDNAMPGIYTSRFKFMDDNYNELKSFDINIEILPFVLDSSRLDYSLYYEARLTSGAIPSFISGNKTEKQMKIELQDMKDHGVLYPTCYNFADYLGKSLKLRNEIGLPKDKFFTLGFHTGSNSSSSALASLTLKIKQWKDSLNHYGYDTTNLYIYGIDEGSITQLQQQIPVWKHVRSLNSKIFVAGYYYTFETVGSLLNTLVYSKGPLAFDAEQQVANFHSGGNKIYAYNCPQVGVENPYVYRKNFGCLLWKMGFDGAMNWAYQRNEGAFWNDFDSRPISPGNFREQAFTYPTTNGIVKTIAWEGFREAINDVRYISTLLNKRDYLQQNGYDVSALNTWINNINCNNNLELLRDEIIDKILELDQINVSINKEIGKDDLECTLYPNPASTIFTVLSETPVLKIEIINIFGQLVFGKQYNSTSVMIDFSSFTNGIYFVRIKNSNNWVVKKIVKQ